MTGAADKQTFASGSPVWRITRAFEVGLAVGFALLPASGVAYLLRFQDPSLLFMEHAAHEFAIASAISVSGLISLVTWRCYQSSGEPFLRWLALGFLSFTLIYAPHGILTRLAHDHTILFLYFGPVSRLMMATLFFVGLLHYGRPSETVRKSPGYWGIWIIVFLGVDVIVTMASLSPLAGRLLIRSTELSALFMTTAGLVVFFVRRIRAPLIVIFALSLAGFAESSVGFLFAAPWNHLWWYAHLVFALGFLLLSFGVLRAFHTTRAFSRVYSQEEMMEQLRQARDAAVHALEQLTVANAQLEELAVRDPLTLASNRRHFFACSNTEISRARRHETSVAVIMIDIDHFKSINDTHGHAAGDAALVALSRAFRSALRPGDLFGRLGGEEFALLLPGTTLASAAATAERFRLMAEGLNISISSDTDIRLTISAGVAACAYACPDIESLLAEADTRLYRAKAAGRNRVISD